MRVTWNAGFSTQWQNQAVAKYKVTDDVDAMPLRWIDLTVVETNNDQGIASPNRFEQLFEGLVKLEHMGMSLTTPDAKAMSQAVRSGQ